MNGYRFLELWLPGDPIPAARPRFDGRNRRTYYDGQARNYADWKTEQVLRLRGSLRSHPFGGNDARYRVDYTVHPDGIRAEISLLDIRLRPVGLRGDWDNFAKAAGDVLEQAGIISNDGRIESGRLRFDPTPGERSRE